MGRWLRGFRERSRISAFFGGKEAFKTRDWTVPARALPEGLAAVHDHESARAFVVRHYPIPVESPGGALGYVLALVVQHVALAERGVGGGPPPVGRIDAVLDDPEAAARLLLASPVSDVRQQSRQLEEIASAAAQRPGGALANNLRLVREFYGKRWTDWP